MPRPLRKVPRIMAKSGRASKTTANSRGPKICRDKNVDDISIRASELDDDHEQLLVRDGIVVGLQQANGRFVDEAGVQVPTSVVHSNSRTRRIIIESTPETNEEYEPYVPTTLPGVADEVESYPCPLCPERVFLTSFGLERHSTEKHPEHLHEILEHIDTIGAEWRRREEELARRRDRVYATRLRQETIARHAIEQVANGTLGQFPGCLESSEVIGDGKNCNLGETNGERRFKACSQCGILVDANSPAAMDSHLRAHKRNDDLKMKLLARYGAEEVGRLICRECNMVFADESGLLLHNEQMHIRRRKYVCKWCGHVTNTMTELNMHKADVHAMPPFTVRSDRDRILRKRLHGRGLIALGAHPRRNEIEDRHGSRNPSSSDLIFRTTCEQCGLRLVRPSLLVRHMLRVHSTSTFSCEIDAPGTSNYKIDVDCERITWTCCENQFSTRREFFQHRMNNHLNKIADSCFWSENHIGQGSLIPNGSLVTNESVCAENSSGISNYIGQIATGPDGSLQVVFPREVIGSDGEFYIVVENNDDLDVQNFKCVQTSGDGVQQVDEVPQQLQLHYDPSVSSSGLVQESVIGSVDHDDEQIVTITAEQYEQLQLQYGSSLDDMSIIYVDRDDLSKDVLVGDVSGTCDRDQDVLHS